MRGTISACITAGNEEGSVRRCLESVRWVDEIVVVDSFSTDRTPEICREYTDLVYRHRWLGYIGQKNLARDLASGDWVLFIDADEEVSDGLREEILRELESDPPEEVAGYEFPRMVRYLGRWIRHGDWYPDVKLRLFRRGRGRCGGKEPHDRMIVDGRVRRLRNPLHHYTYRGISDQLTTINRFSTISARTMFGDGRRFRFIDLLFRAPFRFLRCYLLRLGFLDGMPGFIVATLSSYAVFAKYAKLWELHREARRKDGKTTPPVMPH